MTADVLSEICRKKAEFVPYAPEAITNTHKIAERCHVTIEFGHYKLPHFQVPEGYTSESYLRKLCQEGLERKYLDSEYDKQMLQDRLVMTGYDFQSWDLSIIS